MTEQATKTTVNGHEILHPRESLTLKELSSMSEQYGLGGKSSVERLEKLKNLPAENLALFMTDINRRAQGSDETLVKETASTVGEKTLVDPQDRFNIFNNIVEQIHNLPDDINPERVGDALALTTVMLHPFEDGNGRTSRLMAYMFHEDFDNPAEAQDSFDQLVESREVARERQGGYALNGYIPYMAEGESQANPNDVEAYLTRVLTDPDMSLYSGTYQNATLKMPQPNPVDQAPVQ